MKIGIVADGQAEAQALEHLVARVRCEGVSLLKPLYADMQPYAPPPQIVRASEARLQLLSQRGAVRHLILLDRESNEECPGDFALRLEREFHRRGYLEARVVLKNRAFENWLIGDPRSLDRGASRRIQIKERMIERIEKSGADNVNALAILNGCIADGYNKRADAIEICKTIDPVRVAENSRSFRKLIKELARK